jgi:hypothetical protein
MAVLRRQAYQVCRENQPMTVRQAYYRLVAAGAVPKTQNAYRTVCRVVLELRRTMDVPYSWITDSTRYILRPTFMFPTMAAALERMASLYRRDMWSRTSKYVEIWAESDAVAGVLNVEARQWGVPVYVFRGYASESFKYQIAEELAADGRPAYIYYFGDWDPSGKDIPRDALDKVREFAPDAEIHFERVAVTETQIIGMALPTMPPKATDTRSKNFDGGTVEIEAISPLDLREMVRAVIRRHVDRDEYEAEMIIEYQERATLQSLARNGFGG